MQHSERSNFANLADALESDWQAIARPEQLPPPGDWSTWLILAGRGAGKTRAGAEWVRALAESATVSRIALVAATTADARDTMVEGESGLLAIAPNANRPLYEPSKRRVVWPNGVQATLFSSEEPERLRGPQHGAAWCDELCSWRNVRDTWDNLQFGMRAGRRPQLVITTTPKPIRILKELVKRDGQDVVVTRGRTSDNAANLAPSFLNQIVARYEGTRLGRQELLAEVLEDVEGALWTRDMIDIARAKIALPDMARVVVAVDPSGTRGDDDAGDQIGIVVAGKGVDGRAYVLADRTCKLSPAGWGRRAIAAYHEFRADRLVAERNFGGAMVEHVVKSIDSSISYREVTASRGKIQRAEPIAALYEQGKVTHVGDLAALEDELCQMASNGFMGDGSPDRADALVWALTELMLTQASTTGFLDYYRELAKDAGANSSAT
jgi:predicted phage terminase large subunit-like protein